MFHIEKHAKFFKRVLKAKSENNIRDIISNAPLKDLYATLLVIRHVLKGEIVMTKAGYEELKSKKTQLNIARYSW